MIKVYKNMENWTLSRGVVTNHRGATGTAKVFRSFRTAAQSILVYRLWKPHVACCISNKFIYINGGNKRSRQRTELLSANQGVFKIVWVLVSIDFQVRKVFEKYYWFLRKTDTDTFKNIRFDYIKAYQNGWMAFEEYEIATHRNIIPTKHRRVSNI